MMIRREANTDLWVHSLLEKAGINHSAQGSGVKEIKEALPTASKKGTGRHGAPDFIALVKDFLIVIENKASVSQHEKRDEKGRICDSQDSIMNYAVNGALFYGIHLAKNTSYKKIIAIGISGGEKRHRISPIFIDENEKYIELEEIESFILLSENNIEEYYQREVLKQETNYEKQTEEILKDAAELHEDLRNYGSIQDKDKPLIVAGILLALREFELNNVLIDNMLNGDRINTDGDKIYKAIDDHLKRVNVSPDAKRDRLLRQFLVIKDTTKINEAHATLGKTPLKHFTEFIDKNIFKTINRVSSSEDYLGRFYGEFMSYSGGDGQSLGIILTPRHITDLFCELIDIKPDDRVLDPCCGTAGFLIAAMHHMIQQTDDERIIDDIKQNRLYGYENQPYMFALATANMIIRGDGKSNLQVDDFLRKDSKKLQLKQCTVGLMNPPYSQGSAENQELYEMYFIEHLLDSLAVRGRVAVIIPQSSVTGKTNVEKEIKQNILRKHTLEGVITLNKNTFYGVGVNPCIAIFTAGMPHREDKLCKFINFEEDGYKVSKHIGLIETSSAKDKKQHLLDVWFDRIESQTKFCVQTTIKADDEWLHSFYYFNDEIPSENDFRNTIADYLTFEVNMITHGRAHLLEDEKKKSEKNINHPSNDEEWKEYHIGGDEGLFEVGGTKTTHPSELIQDGDVPRITCASTNNALEGFYKNNPTEKGGVLTVDSATVGYVSYQNSDFIATDHVEKVSLRNDAKMNKYIGIFLKTSIDKSKGTKYGYGYKFSQGRIRRQKVLLPTDASQKPNWQYMEDYVKKEMKSLAGVVADYYEEKIVCEANKLSNSNKMEWSGIRIDDVIDINCEHASSTDKNTVSDSKVSDYLLAYKFATGKERDFDLDDTKWIEFCVDDIFNLIQRGRRLTKKDQIDGQIPYISSTGLNNGLDGFIGNTDKVRMFEDCLTIANSGSVGATFYHRYKFIGSDHITALKIDNATENVYLFLATIIKDLGNKYSFNREINDTRIRREKILLPTRDGKPDYEFMDKFVAIQKIKSIYQVLSYMKSQYLS